jgi:hypothetical protein
VIVVVEDEPLLRIVHNTNKYYNELYNIDGSHGNHGKHGSGRAVDGSREKAAVAAVVRCDSDCIIGG